MSTAARPYAQAVSETRRRESARKRFARAGSSSRSSVIVPEDESHHVAADHGFGSALLRFRRIFRLFAHGDPVAEADEALEVIVGAPINAAHRDVLAEMLASLGQHDPERPARDLRILEEELVEIAHPVEEEAIGVGTLDLDILRHRRDAAVFGRLRLRGRGG